MNPLTKHVTETKNLFLTASDLLASPNDFQVKGPRPNSQFTSVRNDECRRKKKTTKIKITEEVNFKKLNKNREYLRNNSDIEI